MSIRENLDISAYLVVGPENTLGRPVKTIIREAVAQGFTCIQIRSKVASAREMIALCAEAAEVLAGLAEAPEMIVNLQGDAPLTPAWFVEDLVTGLRAAGDAGAAQ